MADRQMTNFYKPILVRGKVEIYIALFTQRIVRPEPAQCDDPAAPPTGGRGCVQDILGASGTADRE
jgi:hypothetical protein